MDWLDGLDTDVLLETIEQELQYDLPGFSLQELFAQLLNGQLQLDLPALLAQIGQAVWATATAQLDVLGQLILLAIAFAVLKQLENGFASASIQKTTELAMQAVAVLLILQGARQALLYGEQAVCHLTELMQVLLPVQLLLMAGLGNLKTAGLLQPSLLVIVQGTAVLFRAVLLPLITMELLLKLVNSFSDVYRLNKLAAFLRKLILLGISFSVTILLAALSILGVGGHAVDRLSLRVARYVTGAAVPVVGGMLSGLLDTFLSGGMVIRNAIGLVGLLVVLLLTVLPACKLLVLYFLYSFAAALLQPLGDSKLVFLLEQTASSFMLLFAAIALTGVLFFFMVLIVLAASGAAF